MQAVIIPITLNNIFTWSIIQLYPIYTLKNQHKKN